MQWGKGGIETLGDRIHKDAKHLLGFNEVGGCGRGGRLAAAALHVEERQEEPSLGPVLPCLPGLPACTPRTQ